VHTFIGTKLLSSNLTQPAQKPFEIHDTRLAGFTLRVQPTGTRSYYARFGGNRRFALGKVGALQPGEARYKCQKFWVAWPMAVTPCTASTVKA
jgi:Arm DNA-binding domain